MVLLKKVFLGMLSTFPIFSEKVYFFRGTWGRPPPLIGACPLKSFLRPPLYLRVDRVDRRQIYVRAL